jgi:RNA polymerase sigma-70 factor (ECF subfamily)
MDPEPLDVLLEKLSRGDLVAAEQLFVAYEPYLRKLVRRYLPKQLRAKFDSVDVVQSVWVDVLHGLRQSGRCFANADHLRAFLVLVARHRLSDRVRHFRQASAREQQLAQTAPDELPSCRLPRPSEIVQADDLWEQLLALCPPAHHEVLRLKRAGLRSADIAAQTGLHEDSIRRILRKLARQMAFGPEALVAPPSADA